MAVSDSKSAIPRTQPVRLQSVKYPAYHAVAELNRALEQVIESLGHLPGFDFFRLDRIKNYQVMIEEVRALANHDLTETLNEREFGNAAHYERLRLKWQNRFKDPNKILPDTTRYKPQTRKQNLKQQHLRKPSKKRSS